MDAIDVKSLQAFIRSGGYAWPGGYPMALLMMDGEPICAAAARENYRLIRRTMRDRRPWFVDRQWTPAALFIHWEGEPLTCAHSGTAIPSAYGEMEA